MTFREILLAVNAEEFIIKCVVLSLLMLCVNSALVNEKEILSKSNNAIPKATKFSVLNSTTTLAAKTTNIKGVSSTNGQPSINENKTSTFIHHRSRETEDEMATSQPTLLNIAMNGPDLSSIAAGSVSSTSQAPSFTASNNKPITSLIYNVSTSSNVKFINSTQFHDYSSLFNNFKRKVTRQRETTLLLNSTKVFANSTKLYQTFIVKKNYSLTTRESEQIVTTDQVTETWVNNEGSSNRQKDALTTSSNQQEDVTSTSSNRHVDVTTTSYNRYEDVSTTSSNSYEDVSTTSSNSYEDVSTTSSNSYEDVSTTSSNSYEDVSTTSSNQHKDITPTSSNSPEDVTTTLEVSSNRHEDVTTTSSHSNENITTTSSHSNENITTTSSNRYEDVTTTSSNSYEDVTSTSSNQHKDVTPTSSNSHEDVTTMVEVSSNRHEDVTTTLEVSSNRHEDVMPTLKVSFNRHEDVTTTSSNQREDVTSTSSNQHEDVTTTSFNRHEDITSTVEVLPNRYEDVTSKPEVSSNSYEDVTSTLKVSSNQHEDVTSTLEASSNRHEDVTTTSSNQHEDVTSTSSNQHEDVTSTSSNRYEDVTTTSSNRHEDITSTVEVSSNQHEDVTTSIPVTNSSLNSFTDSLPVQKTIEITNKNEWALPVVVCISALLVATWALWIAICCRKMIRGVADRHQPDQTDYHNRLSQDKRHEWMFESATPFSFTEIPSRQKQTKVQESNGQQLNVQHNQPTKRDSGADIKLSMYQSVVPKINTDSEGIEMERIPSVDEDNQNIREVNNMYYNNEKSDNRLQRYDYRFIPDVSESKTSSSLTRQSSSSSDYGNADSFNHDSWYSTTNNNNIRYPITSDQIKKCGNTGTGNGGVSYYIKCVQCQRSEHIGGYNGYEAKEFMRNSDNLNRSNSYQGYDVIEGHMAGRVMTRGQNEELMQIDDDDDDNIITVVQDSIDTSYSMGEATRQAGAPRPGMHKCVSFDDTHIRENRERHAALYKKSPTRKISTVSDTGTTSSNFANHGLMAMASCYETVDNLAETGDFPVGSRFYIGSSHENVSSLHYQMIELNMSLKPFTENSNSDLVDKTKSNVSGMTNSDLVDKTKSNVSKMINSDFVDKTKSSVSGMINSELVDKTKSNVSGMTNSDLVDKTKSSVSGMIISDLVDKTKSSVSGMINSDLVDKTKSSVSGMTNSDLVDKTKSSVSGKINSDLVDKTKSSVSGKIIGKSLGTNDKNNDSDKPRSHSTDEYILPIVKQANMKIMADRQLRKLMSMQSKQNQDSNSFSNELVSSVEANCAFQISNESHNLSKNKFNPPSNATPSLKARAPPRRISYPLQIPKIVVINDCEIRVDCENIPTEQPARVRRIARANNPFFIEAQIPNRKSEEKIRRSSAPSMHREPDSRETAGQDHMTRSTSGDHLCLTSGKRQIYGQLTTKSESSEFFDLIQNSRKENRSDDERLKKIIDDRYNALFNNKQGAGNRTQTHSYTHELSPKIKKFISNYNPSPLSKEALQNTQHIVTKSRFEPILETHSSKIPPDMRSNQPDGHAQFKRNKDYVSVSGYRQKMASFLNNTLDVESGFLPVSSVNNNNTVDYTSSNNEKCLRPSLARGTDGQDSDPEIRNEKYQTRPGNEFFGSKEPSNDGFRTMAAKSKITDDQWHSFDAGSLNSYSKPGNSDSELPSHLDQFLMSSKTLEQTSHRKSKVYPLLIPGEVTNISLLKDKLLLSVKDKCNQDQQNKHSFTSYSEAPFSLVISNISAKHNNTSGGTAARKQNGCQLRFEDNFDETFSARFEDNFDETSSAKHIFIGKPRADVPENCVQENSVPHKLHNFQVSTSPILSTKSTDSYVKTNDLKDQSKQTKTTHLFHVTKLCTMDTDKYSNSDKFESLQKTRKRNRLSIFSPGSKLKQIPLPKLRSRSLDIPCDPDIIKFREIALESDRPRYNSDGFENWARLVTQNETVFVTSANDTQLRHDIHHVTGLDRVRSEVELHYYPESSPFVTANVNGRYSDNLGLAKLFYVDDRQESFI